MKILKLLPFVLCFSSFLLTAEENTLSLSLTTDVAYHTKTYYEAGDSHFAAPDEPFRIIKARTTFAASYKIPVLTGESPLFAGNNITFTGKVMLTPVSLAPTLSVTFSPAAFFDLEAGIDSGSGWNIGMLKGLRQYNPAKKTYDDITSFSAWYIQPYVKATIKFDVGALWPGDWHHIVGLASFGVGYQSLVGASQKIWEFQTYAGHADGMVYAQYYVIGYQMPIKLSMIAMTFDFTGHFFASDYGEFADSFCGDFMTKEIGPMFEITLNKKNILYAGIFFLARRSFKEEHTEEEVEPSLTYSGTEWLWDYSAVRWVHYFN